jgi:hypothetical protein
MQEWARYLLAGDVCNSFQKDTNPNLANHQSLSLKQEPQQSFFAIGQFISPFFVPLTLNGKQ